MLHCKKIFLAVFTLTIMLCMSGCTMYIFDARYYEAKKYAKKHSGTYILDSQLYSEVLGHQAELQQLKEKRLIAQKQLEQQIKYNKNARWLEHQDEYKRLALSKSGYYNEKNAQALFVMDELDKRFGAKKVLSNGKTYFSYLDNVDKQIKVPEVLLNKIGGETTKNKKYKRIVYPQYFYIDDNDEVQLISVGVVYLYTNTNNVYNMKKDSEFDIFFVNGEWLYLKKSNIFYLDGQKAQ